MNRYQFLLMLVIGALLGSAATIAYYQTRPTAEPASTPTPSPTATATASSTATATATASATPTATPQPTPLSQDGMVVNQPLSNALVQSPLTVSGTATGSWYFEAQFPVCLLDGNGQQVVCNPAKAQGDWMTDQPVPFTDTLTFTAPATNNGTLVLKNDNPSGLPANARSVSLPVRFR